MSATKESDYRRQLVDDPGNVVFVELAELLTERGDRLPAMEVLLAGLSANPSCHRGRLILAKLYYELGFFPFAAREIHIVRESLPELDSVRRLADRFDPEVPQGDSPGAGGAAERTVAEEEFDMAEIELIGEEETPLTKPK